MRWLAHFVIGAAVAGILFYLLGSSSYAIMIYSFFAGMCALVPDIDYSGSKARKALDAFVMMSAFLLVYLAHCGSAECVFSLDFIARFLALIGLYFLVMMLFRHRGVMHSLLAAGIISFAVFLILGFGFGIAALLGYLSHLLADRELKLL
ncbi:MAG: metal-dependent hydrolase [Candidatus Micrarchaeia archaeon]